MSDPTVPTRAWHNSPGHTPASSRGSQASRNLIRAGLEWSLAARLRVRKPQFQSPPVGSRLNPAFIYFHVYHINAWYKINLGIRSRHKRANADLGMRYNPAA
jgi:hypothetical protein